MRDAWNSVPAGISVRGAVWHYCVTPSPAEAVADSGISRRTFWARSFRRTNTRGHCARACGAMSVERLGLARRLVSNPG